MFRLHFPYRISLPTFEQETGIAAL